MRNKAKFLIVALLAALALVVSQSAYAAQNDNTRPGWGFGDKNHIHIGPPGHSQFPGDGDNDADDHNNALRLYIQHWVNLMVKFQHDMFWNFTHHH